MYTMIDDVHRGDIKVSVLPKENLIYNVGGRKKH